MTRRNRRAFARLAGIVCLALLVPTPSARADARVAGEGPKRPNILFIAVDDLNTHVGCYGNALVKTPHIDRLAKSGVRFERAYCQFPLCNPSRTSLLTGRYPTTTRVVENLTWLRDNLPDVVTLPQFFRGHGYVTLRVGKIFHGGLDDQKAWVEGGEPVKPRKPRTPEQAEQYRKQSDRWVAVEGKGANLPDYKTANRAIELLEKHRSGPFFLAVGFVKPHTALIAPKRSFDLYDPAKIPLPPDFAPVPTVAKGVPGQALTPNGDLFIKRQASKEEARQMIAAYYACVSFVDEQVGRLLEALDRLGLRENTIIVFFGDHGFHLGEKGKWSKHGSLYEAGTHVPMIIAAPKAPANGKSSGRTVGLIDLYPTLADLAGLPAPKGLEGHSLAPLLKDAQAAWEHPAFTVSTRGKGLGRSVRTERWRYTEWDAEGKLAELYDHSTDPHEMRNLVGEPAHTEVVARLRRALRERLPAVLQRK